ncbi:NUDIX domain-containing protein [Aeromicrobium sp. Leaf350]|uniref:NUDIX domain-containing protein n=1 Tax=Aeromicrobium sp. Leaf350 TaxID=2876565 RepID=UPI001E36F8D1|nr:NUDIX domain-containing protein [Aeromicrobium sp. Leaf350]
MTSVSDLPTTHPRQVVAIVLRWHQKVGLFRRSQAVGHDRGLWHCITGYIDPGLDPRTQALLEVHEETGLRTVDLAALHTGPTLQIGDTGGHQWIVHTFVGETMHRRLQLNWEHDRYRWVSPRAVGRYTTVTWLDEVIQAVGAEART